MEWLGPGSKVKSLAPSPQVTLLPRRSLRDGPYNIRREQQEHVVNSLYAPYMT